MKGFKIVDGRIVIDGVTYSQNPNEVKIMGKKGNIHSINIPGKGQFFPIYGEYIDSTIPVVDDSTPIVEDTKPKRKPKSK